VDDALWSTLAEANVLGLAVPESLGGMGLGLLELCVLLEEIGRAVAPVPVLPALVLGGLPLARFGSPAQQQRWLPALARGEIVLSAALEDAASAEPARPATRARRDDRGGSFRLSGRKRLVPVAGRAARVLVPAATDEGVGIFLVDPAAAGVRLGFGRTSSSQPLFEMILDDAPVADVELLGGDARGGDRVAAWLHDCATVATCATQVGVSERAIEITTGYLKEREQFGAPIGSFPAVQQRAADAWIDLQAMRWTTWRAAWLLAEGLPASREAAVAKFWAADAGSRIANTTQHLHGGLGVDLDYPIHRYFLWSKALELAWGGATPQLARLGAEMARSGPQELA
jgi:alkylation response protein AidB-like acyl-CoA dehydrogenase